MTFFSSPAKLLEAGEKAALVSRALDSFYRNHLVIRVYEEGTVTGD